MPEMPQHTTKTTRVYHVAVALPDQPSSAENQVRLILGIHDYEMTPAAFRQFVACLVKADQDMPA